MTHAHEIATKALRARETLHGILRSEYARAMAPWRDLLRRVSAGYGEPMAETLLRLVRDASEQPDAPELIMNLLAAFADEADRTEQYQPKTGAESFVRDCQSMGGAVGMGKILGLSE